MALDAPPNRLMTADEAAARLRLSRGHVYRLGREGTLPMLRIGERGGLRVRANDVEALLRPVNTNETDAP